MWDGAHRQSREGVLRVWRDEVLDQLDDEDLAVVEAEQAAGDAAHAAAVALRQAEVLRLCRDLQRAARSVLVTATDLSPWELLAGCGSPGLCPSLEAVGSWVRACMESYDGLQVALGITEAEEPRFGTGARR
jgi:hypothetical protein